MKRIYLDHAATSPLRPEVRKAMEPYMANTYGNPSSLHAFGREARIALDAARSGIASHLNCEPGELVFTSGGTESDNAALFGIAWSKGLDVMSNKGASRGHIITTSVEHHAVLHTCRRLEELGFTVTYLEVDKTGQVSPEQFMAAIRPDTFLVSIIFGNNEVGTLQPLEEIGKLAQERGIVVHTDAVQALGTMEIDLKALPVDFMSFSAHKVNGPKGVGLLYVAQDTKWTPLLYGGSQERNRRAGTENVAGIVGFAEAVKLAAEEREHKHKLLWELRTRFLDRLATELAPMELVVNGHPEDVLPHIMNVSFPGLSTDTLLMNLDLAGVAASSGSACSSGSLELSHVLVAMGLPEAHQRSAVRFSIGYGTTQEELDDAAERIAAVVRNQYERLHRS